MRQGKRLTRLNKELEDLKTYKDIFTVVTDPNDFLKWRVSFKGAEGTLFQGEDFTLEFKFPVNYVSDK